MPNKFKQSILDVGCGSAKVEFSIGIDKYPLENVDICHDLNKYPWPIESFSMEKIIFSHSMNHLDDIEKLISECYRILKPEGLIEIVAPHFSSDNFLTDPTHKFSLGYRSMDYFVTNGGVEYRYCSEDIKFILLSRKLSFRECDASWRKKTKFNPAKLFGFEGLINLFPRIYERFFSGLIPASEVSYLLKKA